MKDDLIRIVKKYGKNISESFYKKFSITEKSAHDFVTDVDKKIEKDIISELRKLSPNASFYGEETGLIKGSNNHSFVIDPIDGTANFIFGIPYFSISIAEIIENKVVQAIVYNPMCKDLFYADINSGAYLNYNKISVSNKTKITDAYAILGFSANSKNIAKYERDHSKLFNETKKALPLLAPSLNLCAVAMGKADIFVDFGCSFEGQVAGGFILQQAGGFVRNYDNEEYDFEQVGIVATNGKILL